MKIPYVFVVATAFVCLFVGCGGNRGSDVNAYFKSVAQATQPYSETFTAGNRAYSGFIANRVPAAAVAPVVGNVESALRSVHARIAGLDAPEQARGVETELLTLYAHNAQVASHLKQSMRYLAAAQVALAPLDAYNRLLQDRLATATTSSAQSTALNAYAIRVRHIERRLRALSAPPLLEPWRLDELSSLHNAIALAGNLSNAVTSGDSSRANRLS